MVDKRMWTVLVSCPDCVAAAKEKELSAGFCDGTNVAYCTKRDGQPQKSFHLVVGEGEERVKEAVKELAGMLAVMFGKAEEKKG